MINRIGRGIAAAGYGERGAPDGRDVADRDGPVLQDMWRRQMSDAEAQKAMRGGPGQARRRHGVNDHTARTAVRNVTVQTVKARGVVSSATILAAVDADPTAAR